MDNNTIALLYGMAWGAVIVFIILGTQAYITLSAKYYALKETEKRLLDEREFLEANLNECIEALAVAESKLRGEE